MKSGMTWWEPRGRDKEGHITYKRHNGSLRTKPLSYRIRHAFGRLSLRNVLESRKRRVSKHHNKALNKRLKQKRDHARRRT